MIPTPPLTIRGVKYILPMPLFTLKEMQDREKHGLEIPNYGLKVAVLL